MSPERVVPRKRSLQTPLRPVWLQRVGRNHYHNWGLLPAWITLDISKTCSLLMGLNGLEQEPWELRSSYVGVWTDVDLDGYRLYSEHIVKQCLLSAPLFCST